MARNRLPTRISCLAMLVATAGSLEAASTPKLSGNLLGHVRNAAGKLQMGATVALYNRYDKLVRQESTNDNGIFVFDALAPDDYSVLVSLTSFVPALRRGIAVQPGLDSVLNINLTSVFSTIEVVYHSPGQALMTDEWKWALRATQRTRPVLRIAPDIQVSTSRRPAQVFSETRGLVSVSAGDPASMGSTGTQTDLGTAFAVATSIYGRDQVQFSGNFGFVPNSNMPAAGFRTTYSRKSDDFFSPKVTLAYRQINFQGGPGMGNRVPALRTMSLSSIDKIALSDRVRLEYGFSLESVMFMSRLNVLSPFARLTYEAGELGLLKLGYSAGGPPAELYTGQGVNDSDGELKRDLAALSILPRVSLINGRARTQRTRNIEAAFERKIGSRKIEAAVYHEAVAHAAVNMIADSALYVDDVLPDLGSRSATFNAGSVERWGYMGTVTQSIGERFEASLSVGRGGALAPGNRVLASELAGDLRSTLRNVQRMWASARISGTIPKAGTRYASSYGWTDYGTVMPGHLFLTSRALPETGLNFFIRQPVPSVVNMHGRLELTAELRNLLAQGYIPLLAAGDRQITLIQSPRAVRGGLSFIF